MVRRQLREAPSARAPSAGAFASRGRRRAPQSAASRSLDHRLGALEIEAEAYFLEPLLEHPMQQPSLVLGVEHQKATTAGADQFAAQRAIAFGGLIPLVDPAVRHIARALFLLLPLLVHQFGKPRQVTLQKRNVASPAQFLDVVQIVDY